LFGGALQAGIIPLNDVYNSGNPFDGTTVSFSDVEESNGAPADPATNFYRTPQVFGNRLTWNPSGFRTQVIPGSGTDQVLSEISMLITADPGLAISSINFSELGDYEVFGTASATAELNYSWEVIAAANSPAGATGSSAAAISYTSPPDSTGIWDLDFALNVAAIQADVTALKLTISNELSVEANGLVSGAFIAKKQVPGVNVTTVPVPEPSAFIMALFSVALMARRGIRSIA
jgi:hypothetical protein